MSNSDEHKKRTNLHKQPNIIFVNSSPSYLFVCRTSIWERYDILLLTCLLCNTLYCWNIYWILGFNTFYGGLENIYIWIGNKMESYSSIHPYKILPFLFSVITPSPLVHQFFTINPVHTSTEPYYNHLSLNHVSHGPESLVCEGVQIKIINTIHPSLH